MRTESSTFPNKSMTDRTADNETSVLTSADQLTTLKADRKTANLEATELFSLFTADIIKKEVLFVR